MTRRHKYRNGKATATFAELTYAEQAKAMNIAKLNQRKMEQAHDRKAAQEGRPEREA